jgi:hypothetical protein
VGIKQRMSKLKNLCIDLLDSQYHNNYHYH